MEHGEGGERAQEEYQCPVCRKGGFTTLKGVAEHCAEQTATSSGTRGQETTEKREDIESSIVSTDTNMLIVAELKKTQRQQDAYRREDKAYREMQMSVNIEDRRQL